MAAERYEPESRRRKWSLEEYLQFSSRADWRYEFIDGRVTPVGWPNFELDPDEPWDEPTTQAMSGGGNEHNLIGFDTGTAFKFGLRGSSCQPFGSETRVQLNDVGDYAYPDVTVACQPELAPGATQVLLNPAVIVEVLSPSTSRYDRTRKWALYQQLPSLRDYLMIATKPPCVEWFSREDAKTWTFRVVEGLDAQIHLSSINCTLHLRDVYERSNF